MSARKHRPVFLSLLRMRYPATAVTSIAHRISGLLLFVSTPFLIYGIDHSLSNEQAYADTLVGLASPVARLTLLVLLWAFAHHLLAGIRSLLLDVDLGMSLPAALRSAFAVNAASVAVAVFGLWLLP